MITVRKLLLADDSLAIQKVIDLTFTDEGMEVTTVGDGQDALDKLNQFTPDVVLADVYMPGVDGYKLCRFIKQNERFRGVPVMLLVGSFEPFDEAEAKNAGADDVVTKPFQSIRDLVSRVGLLMRHERAAPADTVERSKTLGDEMSPEQSDVKVFVEAPSVEPDATVFVEAPVMEVEPPQAPEHACPPVIDLQTADTRKLEPISNLTAAPPPGHNEFADTIELQVVEEAPSEEPNAAAALPPTEVTAAVDAVKFDDEGVLDLGDVDSFSAATGEDDFVLDVDVEPVNISSASRLAEAEQPVESVQETAATQVNDETNTDAPSSAQPNSSGLSSDAIEAISRRVVEQMSDKVVREIAWEVVPELSELLIKKRLEHRD